MLQHEIINSFSSSKKAAVEMARGEIERNEKINFWHLTQIDSESIARERSSREFNISCVIVNKLIWNDYQGFLAFNSKAVLCGFQFSSIQYEIRIDYISFLVFVFIFTQLCSVVALIFWVIEKFN